MIKINVGGMASKETYNLVVESGPGKIEAKITSDMAGVKQVADGSADYYLGACATGGGGALSMAIAVLGYQNCATVSMPGKPPKEADIEKAVQQGKKAFGFTNDHVALAVPLIIKAILAKHNLPS